MERVKRRIRRIGMMGILEDDPETIRLVKSMTTVVSVAVIAVCIPWVVIYLALGSVQSAAIPFTYQVITVVGLVHLARTKSITFLRQSQLTMYLVFPFLLMWTLGGFRNGSAVAIWAVSAPLVAVGTNPWPWTGGFVGLSALSVLIDPTLAQSAPDIPTWMVTTLFALNFIGVGSTVLVALVYSGREQSKAKAALQLKHAELELEQARSDQLLLNILPASIAERLKSGEEVIADRVPDVTVLFADIVGFTPLTRDMSPQEVVEALSSIFGDLDDIADRFNLDKIKTLGDGYMAVGNATQPLEDHTSAVLGMALEMRDRVAGRAFGPGVLEFRIGIDTGQAVGAVIGKKRFTYDLWGNTINAASRMESHGLPGQVQTTSRVAEMMSGQFVFDERGVIDVKGIGEMTTYLLRHRIDRPSI